MEEVKQQRVMTTKMLPGDIVCRSESDAAAWMILSVADCLDVATHAKERGEKHIGVWLRPDTPHYTVVGKVCHLEGLHSMILVHRDNSERWGGNSKDKND